METKQDISYGIVPLLLTDTGWRVLLVHQISYRGDSFWIFPKGHAELGESPLVAARRELEEETGVTDITIMDNTPITIWYTFVHEGVKIEKSVEYFIGIASSDRTYISQPEEIKELRWCTIDDAFNLLTHQNSKDVLHQVSERLG